MCPILCHWVSCLLWPTFVSIIAHLFSELQGEHRAAHVLSMNLYESDLTQTCTETRTCMFTVEAYVCMPGSVCANTQKPGRHFPWSHSPESLVIPMPMGTALM